MRVRLPGFIPALVLFTGIALSACDAPANDGPSAQLGPTPGLQASDNAPEADKPHSDVPPPSRAVFTDADCEHEEWIGQPLDEAAVKATGQTYRILEPDSMMTMDHNPQRINVVHDKGKVTRVWCG